MYAVAVDKRQLKKTLYILAAIAVLAVIAVFVGDRVWGGNKDGLVRGDTAATREDYLSSIGLEFKKNSSVVEVTVPKEFDKNFTSYNEMLKAAGFDLSEFKGQTLSKCTYIVTNRGDLGKNINAVLLVKDGYIVAGHLVSADDGRLYPLVSVSKTILPNQSPPEEDTESSEASYPTE